jgi:hypothetical protein
MRRGDRFSASQNPKVFDRRSRNAHSERWWKRAAGLGAAAAIVAAGMTPLVSPAIAATASDSGTERVSVATGGIQGNGASHGVDVSGDGSKVVFGSGATNLVRNGTNRFDLYVRDRPSGVTEIVSVNDAGQSGTSTSLWPTISEDGQRVAFHSIANNLIGNDDNGEADIFVRDRSTNKTILASGAADGTPSNGRSQRAEISADGEYVVFESDATDIVSGFPACDRTGTGGPACIQRVYLRHIDSGATKLVSQSSSEVPAVRGGDSASVSADGRYVAFRTFSFDLEGSSPSDWGNIYVRDTVSGTTSVVAGSSNRQAGKPTISGDGRFVAYRFQTNLMKVVNRTSGAGMSIGAGSIARLRLNHDGRFLVYYLGGNGARAFVWDRLTQERTDVMIADDGSPIPVGANASETFGPPGISDNGRIVAFWTKSDGVVSGDTGGIEDVYVRDRGDLLEPTVTKPKFDPAEPLATEPVTITATASDSGRGDAIVAAAEVSIDDGDWQPMNAADGSFDSVTEDVTATLDNLRSGGHEACIRATDGRGNTTLRPSCDRFTSLSSESPIAITITRVASNGGFQELPFARVWAVPADGSLPRKGDWDYDTRSDSRANTSLSPAGFIEPFGTHGESIITGSGKAIVRIEAGVERKPNGGVELIDLSPRSGDQGLLLTVDLETGEWDNLDGLAPFPASCVSSTSGRDSDTRPGELCFAISTLSESGDMDSDGLLDAWERFGLSMDEDSDIELDLPGWGATPDHKDLFVEYDVERTADWSGRAQNGLVAAQQAFARAPVDAGGTSNPDGKHGIRLWIDAPDYDDDPGNKNELEFPGTGGGEITGVEEVCGVKGGDWWWEDAFDPNDDGFYAEKRRSFDSERRWVFRYALKQKDETKCGSGGQAEIGGNDFVVFNSELSGELNDSDDNPYSWPGGETFMHELGHTLNLRHGGFQNRNHKPNYVSLMNYRYSFTLRQQSTGDGFLDFSPALPPPPKGDDQANPTGPRPGLLPAFREDDPPQGVVLGPDRDHDILYPSFNCEFTSIPANSPFELLPGSDFTTRHAGIDADLSELPGSCGRELHSLNPLFDTHVDHDDWSKIRLGFHTSGAAGDGAELSDDEDLPDDAQIAELRRLVTTTDLAAEAAGPSDPATVGNPFEVTATVRNKGNVTAHEPKLTIELADGLALEKAPARCTGSPLVCSLDQVIAGGEGSVTLLVVGESEGATVSRVSVTDPSTTDRDESNDSVELSIVVDATDDQPGGEPTGEPTSDPSGDQPVGNDPSSDDSDGDQSPGEPPGNNDSPSDEAPTDDPSVNGGATTGSSEQGPGSGTGGGSDTVSGDGNADAAAESGDQATGGSVASTGSAVAVAALAGGLSLGFGSLILIARRRA